MDRTTPRIKGPSYTTLAVLLGILIAGCLAVILATGLDGDWATGTLAGWLGAGVMGLSGFWTMRRALGGGQRVFLKFLLGGMLGRLALCGAYAGLALGLEWFDQNGFVLGLLAGIAVFMGVEVIGLERSARRLSSKPGDCLESCTRSD